VLLESIERIVHGPLTTLILLETLAYYHPEVEMRSFEYRALNPIIVNREVTFYGSWNGAEEVLLWVQDEAGVVGMQGRVLL
jgi:hydroxyacyl-ACP dehydratase HTD2-like protein with hotdog domain